MKNCIKILSISFILLFILSCGNNNDPIENLKRIARYEGTLITTRNTRQIETNKCTLIVNENGSIEIIIEGGNIRYSRETILKEELTKVGDASYMAEKGGKK